MSDEKAQVKIYDCKASGDCVPVCPNQAIEMVLREV